MEPQAPSILCCWALRRRVAALCVGDDAYESVLCTDAGRAERRQGLFFLRFAAEYGARGKEARGDCVWCAQAAVEEALGFPSPAELLRELIALAHYPAGPEAEGGPEPASSGGQAYSYGRSTGLAADEEFDEGEDAEDAAGEPAVAGQQLGNTWQSGGGL